MRSQYDLRQKTSTGLVILILTTLLTLSCSTESSEAEAVLTSYLKERGVKEVQIDLFATNPGNNDNAYISATITHNFATAEGNPQKEYVGYILTKSDGKWSVQRNAKYTKEKDKALLYLSGSK